MTDITADIHLYRETARHIWNSCLRNVGDSTGEALESFERICEDLFSAIIVGPYSVEEPANQLNIQGFKSICVIPVVDTGTPVLVNRTKPAGPYWDAPLAMVKPESIQLSLIGFFDWDSSSHIDLRYIRVRIDACVANSEVVGREALIEAFHSKVVINQPAQI
jgi:hypothetical protein